MELYNNIILRSLTECLSISGMCPIIIEWSLLLGYVVRVMCSEGYVFLRLDTKEPSCTTRESDQRSLSASLVNSVSLDSSSIHITKSSQNKWQYDTPFNLHHENGCNDIKGGMMDANNNHCECQADSKVDVIVGHASGDTE